MKTNRYGTPKERLIKIVICLLIIIVIALLNGAGKKFYLSKYIEECYEYKKETTTYNWTSWNYEPDGCEWLFCITCPCELVTKVTYFNLSSNTNECGKYHLV
ncbi:hypothetical protein LCGC14_3106160, partial [marine sediment metagenome]